MSPLAKKKYKKSYTQSIQHYLRFVSFCLFFNFGFFKVGGNPFLLEMAVPQAYRLSLSKSSMTNLEVKKLSKKDIPPTLMKIFCQNLDYF